MNFGGAIYRSYYTVTTHASPYMYTHLGSPSDFDVVEGHWQVQRHSDEHQTKFPSFPPSQVFTTFQKFPSFRFRFDRRGTGPKGRRSYVLKPAKKKKNIDTTGWLPLYYERQDKKARKPGHRSFYPPSSCNRRSSVKGISNYTLQANHWCLPAK